MSGEKPFRDLVETVIKGGPSKLLKAVACVPFSHPEDREPAIYDFVFSDGSVWELNTYAEAWTCLWGPNISGIFQSEEWESEIQCVPETELKQPRP